MNKITRRILTGVSITFHVFFLLLLVSFIFIRKPLSITFLDMDSQSLRYTTGACIVTVPKGGRGLVFGAVEFSLKTGESAALQFSVYQDKTQLNMGIAPLYDVSIVSVETSGFGMEIKALKPGKTVLQIFTENGFRDIAIITVSE